MEERGENIVKKQITRLTLDLMSGTDLNLKASSSPLKASHTAVFWLFKKTSSEFHVLVATKPTVAWFCGNASAFCIVFSSVVTNIYVSDNSFDSTKPKPLPNDPSVWTEQLGF